MIARLTPVNLLVDFEDRVYRLGETVNLSTVIKPIRNTTILNCKVQLLCKELWEEFFFISVPRFPSSPRSGREGSFTGPPISKHIVERHQEEHMHTTVCFLHNVELLEGNHQTHALEFPISTITVTRPNAQTTRWRLAISVSLLGYRSVQVNLPIKINSSDSA